MNAATSSQMLLAFWRQRDLEAPWGRRALIALLLLGTAAGLYLAPQLWPIQLASNATVVLAVLWLAIVGNLMVQNHPHVARLVPGHVRQLREAAVASWFLTTLCCALLLWLFVPSMPSLPALLLIAAATLVFTAWAIRQWQLWLLLSFGPVLFFGTGLHQRLAPLWTALHELWTGQPWSVLALSLVALGWSITRLFGNGDGGHVVSYACRERMRQASRDSMGGKRGGMAVFGRPGERLARPFERAASAWLAHVLARSRPEVGSVMRRAEIVLHGQQHWLRQSMGALLALSIAALSFVIAFALAGPSLHDNWTKGAYGMAIGLASMGFNPCFALPNMLWHSRREQALMRLLPGMPQGAALNRAVAWLQLRHALVAWALTTVALALLAWAAADLALLCLALAALPLCGLCLLRVPARMKAPTSWTAILPVFGFILGGWGLYGLHQKLDVPLLELAGLVLGVSLALGLWRWRLVTQAPQALPTGWAG
jgi:hypothetical protein